MVKEVQGGRRLLVILCRQAMYIKSNYKLAWTLIYCLWSWSFGSLFKWNVSNTEVAMYNIVLLTGSRNLESELIFGHFVSGLRSIFCTRITAKAPLYWFI